MMFRKCLMPLFVSIFLFEYSDAHDVPFSIETIYWSDGDSGWINGKKNGFAFRLANVDAPPLYGCEDAVRAGYVAKEYMILMSNDVSKLSVSKFYYHGPYGRHIVDVSVSGQDLGKLGITEGVLRRWRFRNKKPIEKRPSWC